jgi:hypothetical protein
MVPSVCGSRWDGVEELPIDAAAEVLVLLEPTLAAVEHQASLALERAPTGAQ